MTTPIPKVGIVSLGCAKALVDSERILTRLRAEGYDISDSYDGADVVIVNTCGFLDSARAESLEAIGEALAENRKVIVTGCIGGDEAAFRALHPSVLAVTGPHQYQAVVEAVHRVAPPQHDPKQSLVPPEGLHLTPHHYAYLKISEGCNNSCSFCIIPSRRGAEQSRPRVAILEEVRRLAGHGVREVTLLGQIVDRYGFDLGGGYELADLLQDVARVEGLHRIRFLTSHPNYMSDRLLDTIANDAKFCPFFELPIQAGNDEVLERMRRGYTVQQFRDLVARIRQRMPDAGIHTDVIVGFPGETEAQFMDTFQVLEDLRLDVIHLAQYSERPGTFAALRLPDGVPAAEKQRRWVMIEAQGKRILGEKHQTLLGQTVTVLIEGRDAKRDRWWGRTPQGKLVFFLDAQNRLGEIVEVELDWTGPFTMIGRQTGAPS